MQATHKTAVILSDRGYVVKERGIIYVKGKGNMRTYFILGRKISRRYGRRIGNANNSLAEVVYGMVRARRRRTFKRDKESESDHTLKDSDHTTVTAADSSTKLGRHNPIRRSIRRLNTFRGGRSPLVDITKTICKAESESRMSLDVESKSQIC